MFLRFLKIFSLLTVITIVLYLSVFATDNSVYNEVVRLHVIANSDSEFDQATKQQVRDLVINTYGDNLSKYQSRDKALDALSTMLKDIENDVNKYLADKTDYKATVTLNESYFPTKSYGDFSLPRGNYTALCINLGLAEGQNFWCVMFPPLCLGASTDDEEELFLSHGISLDSYKLMRAEKPIYKLKFKVLELFNK